MTSRPKKTGLLWTGPAWRAEADAWIRAALADVGRAVVAIDQPHVRPWATAMRVSTDNGVYWFKAAIEPLAYEVPLLRLLAERRPGAVPGVLAGDAERGWMLMEDAGPRVPDLYGDAPPISVWETFLPAYAQLQLDVAPDAHAMVGAGVPDRTTPALVDRLEPVLDDHRLVRPPTDDALDEQELARVRALLPRVREAVTRLDALGLPDSLHHDDLHAWNVCVRAGDYRFIDWGDACVSQPLLSLAIPLAHAEEAAGTTRVRDAYLEPWTALRPRAELVAACEDATLLAQVTGVLKWELVSSGLTDEERSGYEHAIPLRLRRLLELACA